MIICLSEALHHFIVADTSNCSRNMLCVIKSRCITWYATFKDAFYLISVSYQIMCHEWCLYKVQLMCIFWLVLPNETAPSFVFYFVDVFFKVNLTHAAFSFLAPHHWWQLLRSGYERPARRLRDGTWDSPILRVQGQDDVRYRLRVQEPLSGFCGHKRWTS